MAALSSCCAPAAQATCCESSAKASCCGAPAADAVAGETATCGCSAGQPAGAAAPTPEGRGR